MMTDSFVAICLIFGGAFALVSMLGVWRLPDSLSKMHAATKSGAFATGWYLLAATIHFASLRVFIMSLLFLVFYYITAPLGAMFIGRLMDERSRK